MHDPTRVLGRPILRHVYVCPGTDADEYSYASLYIPNLPFSVQAFTSSSPSFYPALRPPPTIARSQARPLNPIKLITGFSSISLSLSHPLDMHRARTYFPYNVVQVTATFRELYVNAASGHGAVIAATQ